MKRMIIAAAIMLVAAGLAAPASASSHPKGWTEWMPFASLRDQQGNQMVLLEWSTYIRVDGTLKDYSHRNAEVNWRITNNSTEFLFWISMGDRTYTCSNGHTEHKGAIDIGPRMLKPGRLIRLSSKSERTGRHPGHVDSIDGKNCPHITEAEFESAATVLRFAINDDKPIKPWTDYGPVTLDE